MKISELIKELKYKEKEHGDIDIFISCGKLKEWLEKTNQNYIVSNPLFIEFEENSKEKWIIIKDWPY